MKSQAELAKEALGLWGPYSQLGMVQEECAELIAAINWYRRNRLNLELLAREIADVEIVLASAKLIVGEELIETAKLQKLQRLQEAIEMEIESRKEIEVAADGS